MLRSFDPIMQDDLKKCLEHMIEILRPVVMANNDSLLEWVYVTLRTVLRKIS